MNLRKEKLVELITENFSHLNIKENELIIVRLPTGIPKQTSQMVGQSIVDALRALGKENPLILLPNEIQIQNLDEEDMKELGWIKDAKTTECNTPDSGLPKPAKVTKVIENLDEQRRIWHREVTELLGKLQDTSPNPPGANTSGYIYPDIF